MQARPGVGVVPEMLASRLISVRAFDADGSMLDAEVVAGSELADVIPAMLAAEGAACLHLHNASQGCFAASVTRAASQDSQGAIRVGSCGDQSPEGRSRSDSAS